MTYTEFISNIIDTRGQWGIADSEYKEMHHIIPVCLGGESDTDKDRFKKNSKHENCIWLTAAEHFIAHKLLMLEHPEELRLALAYYAMVLWRAPNQQRNYEISAEEYEKARLLANEINRQFHTGRVYSIETIEKRRAKMIGQKRSKETKQKLSAAKLGDLNPAKRPEVRAKISATLTGRHLSKETIEKRKLSCEAKLNLYKEMYKKYQTHGGLLKWNNFKTRYKEIGDAIFNEINRGTEK